MMGGIDVGTTPGTPPVVLPFPQSDLWLDATDLATIVQSGGVVSAWNDKSGNGNHVTTFAGAVTTGAVTINGLNTISMNAIGRLRRTGTSFGEPNNGFTVIAIFTKTGAVGTYEALPILLANATGSTGVPMDRWSHATLGHRYAAGDLAVAASTGAFIDLRESIETAHLVSVWVTKSGQGDVDWQEHRTGALTGSALAAGRWGIADQTIHIGGRGDGATTFEGKIGEIIIHNRVLSVADRNAVEAYLINKWFPPKAGGLLYDAMRAAGPKGMWWHRDHVGPQAFDDSGNGRNGTYSTGVYHTTAATPDGRWTARFNALGASGSTNALPTSPDWSIAAGNGMTIVCATRTRIGGGSGAASSMSRGAEWGILLAEDGSQVAVDTLTTSGSLARRRFFFPSASSGWKLMVFRFTNVATDTPTIRVNGVNQAGGTTGSGSSSLTDQGQALIAAGTQLANQPFLSAVYPGILSDVQCATIESAATTEGWY